VDLSDGAGLVRLVGWGWSGGKPGGKQSTDGAEAKEGPEDLGHDEPENREWGNPGEGV
jgi:hypothetical protein